MQLIPKRENTAPENRKHFFDNPRRYDDESEPLTNRSIKRSRTNGSTGQVSIPSLPDPSHLSYGGYGSNSSRQNPYSAPSKYSVNNHVGSAMSNYMPGTTPPQLFTSPSFLSDRWVHYCVPQYCMWTMSICNILILCVLYCFFVICSASIAGNRLHLY